MLLVTNKRYPVPTKQAAVIKITGKGGPINYTPESTVVINYSIFKKTDYEKGKLKELKASCLSGSKLKTLTKIIF